ncbi:MAG: sugar kinase [Solirubrobacteraceae bacterium]|nr:sugar kinase [Solirubrobacteraceae bacterium]
MSVTVVGSIAYDAVKTPFGEREKMLGGAAVHFALAASFFDEVRVVGPVGDDFGDAEYKVLHDRGINTDDIEHVEGGKTFFWKGVYSENLNQRETLVTDLNVFETFEPKLSQESKDAETLFLANIQPDLQRAVNEQSAAKFVALDSMDLWINIAHESLTETIKGVDVVILNDEEIEMYSGKTPIISAAKHILDLGPKAVLAKQGKYGVGVIMEEGTFWLPAYPMEQVIDPTGAGDSFAGGFVGFLAQHVGAEQNLDLYARAAAYGTAVASFNVQEFGTERVARLTGDEIAERVGHLQRITQFSDTAVALRG